jgi:hypothetical protein
MTLVNSLVPIARSCEALPVEDSPWSYKFRADAPRCEGMYRSPVSGDPRMALVSLTFGRVAYDMAKDPYIEIKLSVPATEKTSIRAVGIPERLYYRLDVELGEGEIAFRLPLGDVIAPEGISPDAFGVFGLRTLAGGQNAFLPVHAHKAGTVDSSEVIAVVRPGVDVSDVQWRRYAPGVLPTPWTPVAGAGGLIPEGTRLEIALGKAIPPHTTLEVSYLSEGVGRSDPFIVLDR